MQKKSIWNNKEVNLINKMGENLVNFEERGLIDSWVSNYELFILGLKWCFDQIKIFIEWLEMIIWLQFGRKKNKEMEDFRDRKHNRCGLERKRWRVCWNWRRKPRIVLSSRDNDKLFFANNYAIISNNHLTRNRFTVYANQLTNVFNW